MSFFDPCKNRLGQDLGAILGGFWDDFGGPERHDIPKSKKFKKLHPSHAECKVLAFGDPRKRPRKLYFLILFLTIYKVSLRRSIFEDFRLHWGVDFRHIFASEPFCKRCAFRGDKTYAWPLKLAPSPARPQRLTFSLSTGKRQLLLASQLP